MSNVPTTAFLFQASCVRKMRTAAASTVERLTLPVGLPSFRRRGCCREKVKDRLAAPLVGKQLRDLGAVSPTGWNRKLLGLLQEDCLPL